MPGSHQAALYAALFSVAASAGVVFALLADLQDEHDLPSWGIGTIAAITFFAGVVGQLALAHFADRGYARVMLVGSAMATAVGCGAFVLADNVWEFILARLILGLGFGAMSPVVRGIVAAVDPATSGSRLGFVGSLELGGLMLGPALGGVLADTWNLDTPFILYGAVSALLIPVLATIHIPAMKVEDRGQLLPVLRRPRVRLVALIQIALMIPAGVFEAVWAVFLDDLGASTTVLGVGLLAYGIPYMIVSPIGGRLADKNGGFRTALLGTIGIAPIVMLFGRVTSIWHVVGLAMVEGIVAGLTMPAIATAMVRATRPGEFATGQGVSAAGGMLAAGTTALIATPIYDAVGPQWLYGGAGALSAALAVTVWTLSRPYVGPDGRLTEPTSLDL